MQLLKMWSTPPKAAPLKTSGVFPCSLKLWGTLSFLKHESLI